LRAVGRAGEVSDATTTGGGDVEMDEERERKREGRGKITRRRSTIVVECVLRGSPP